MRMKAAPTQHVGEATGVYERKLSSILGVYLCLLIIYMCMYIF